MWLNFFVCFFLRCNQLWAHYSVCVRAVLRKTAFKSIFLNQKSSKKYSLFFWIRAVFGFFINIIVHNSFIQIFEKKYCSIICIWTFGVHFWISCEMLMTWMCRKFVSVWVKPWVFCIYRSCRAEVSPLNPNQLILFSKFTIISWNFPCWRPDQVKGTVISIIKSVKIMNNK